MNDFIQFFAAGIIIFFSVAIIVISSSVTYSRIELSAMKERNKFVLDSMRIIQYDTTKGSK